MRKIEKHSFEAVSLLTVDNGLLDITIIPAIGQPDWVIPSRLILAIEDYDEHIWTYLWRNQEVAVYHLLPREETPEKIVVLEGNTDVHRVGLLTKGKLEQKLVNISAVKDVDIPEGFTTPSLSANMASSSQVIFNDSTTNNSPVIDAEASTTSQNNNQNDVKILPYVFQTVEIDKETYLVPDLDTLSHHLVDLDSE